MQQSNTYIIVFTAILTIVLGGPLSLANQGLKPMQERSIEIDTKKQILGAVIDTEQMSNQEILDYYEASIKSIVIDYDGEKIETNEKGQPMVAEDINIAKNYKLDAERRQYPVFIFHKEGQPDAPESYIFPMYGSGLWGPIWGYVALETDLNTVRGAVFDHETETPGLGARITEKSVQQRFVGKKIYDEEGELASVKMLKGEGNPPEAIDLHTINGLSGATITAKGLSEMVRNYLEYYQPFINNVREGKTKVASL